MNDRLLCMIGLAARARKIASGTESVVGEVRSERNVKLVLIASDVSQNTLKRIVNCCEFHRTEYRLLSHTCDELSHAIGKSSLISCVAVLDRNFSKAIKKLV